MLSSELLDDADSSTANLLRRRQMATRGGVTDEKIKEVRAIMGPAPSDMEIFRALFQSKNDVSEAVNILFDAPKWQFKKPVKGKQRAAPPPNVPPSQPSQPSKPAGAPPPAGKREIVPPATPQTASQVRTAVGTQAVTREDMKAPQQRSEVIPPAAPQTPSQVRTAVGTQAVTREDAHYRDFKARVWARDFKNSVVLPPGGSFVQPCSNNGADVNLALLPTQSPGGPQVNSSPNLDVKTLEAINAFAQGINDPQLTPLSNVDVKPHIESIIDITQDTRDSQLNFSPNVDVKPPMDGIIDLTQPDRYGSQDYASKRLSSRLTEYKGHPRQETSVTRLKCTLSDPGFRSSPCYNEPSAKIPSQVLYTNSLLQLQALWGEKLVLLGQSSVICLSTCKGQKLIAGDDLAFTFPKIGNDSPVDKRGWGRGKAGAAEIVRFSTEKSGEIGRLPGEWSRNLIPLVQSKKVAISGVCTSCPPTLGLLDSITLALGIFVSKSLLKKYTATPGSSISVSADSSTHNPLLSLLRLLGKRPFMKAEFTPEDLYNRKRSLDLEAKKNGESEPILPTEKRRKLASDGPVVPGEENEAEELSDADLNKIVGTSEGSELREMEPSSNILCELRPYQKQALFWMTKMESGLDLEEAAKTLHPCWEAYHLGDGKSVFYVNVFSGETSVDFPSALQTSRGGILADAMGLGKTVMGISLLVSSPGRGGLFSPGYCGPKIEENSEQNLDITSQLDEVITTQPLATQPSSSKLKPGSKDANGKQRGGGTLIVCPMTLLGQWKTELETHVKPGVLSILTYYGGDRMKDAKSLIDYDIVLTTYGVLTSDSNQNSSMGGIVQGIHWYRIVLDEAHTIKNLRSQAAQAIFKLTSDCRWCLTGTPIQNKLEDVFSLLHFLRIEPWGNFGWWTKLIQKPFDEGDERGLKLLQAILKPLMLRRTKETVDKEGRPIIVLPPADIQMIECELSEQERDFYEALFKKSKVKFDMFVEQGKVLHNYASILELLLRLRQCCDHPYLVMSRGDTGEFADLNKLAKHFMDGVSRSGDGPTPAFVEEVVKEFRKGEKAECPICLEVMEDAVLTSCAHSMCRECLFASWPAYGGGSCPICRQYVSRQDLITAPKENRFHLDVEKNWRASAKVEALMKELNKVKKLGEKSVVFSQWTTFLDLLQIPLKRGKFQFVRLDGSLSQQQREQVIKSFSTDPKIPVMLISLKAGGVGVNLTAASHAFLLDPWWNPAVEEQAIMRIHRIGQLKNVFIKRFICKETVEQRMQLVQARKQRMIAGALNNQEVRAARLEELKMLFR